MPKKRTSTGHEALNEAGEKPSPSPSRPAKERVTFHLPVEMADKLRNIVYWTPGLTLASLAERALGDAIRKHEQQRGEPFPTRKSELSAGRPVRM